MKFVYFYIIIIVVIIVLGMVHLPMALLILILGMALVGVSPSQIVQDGIVFKVLQLIIIVTLKIKRTQMIQSVDMII